VADQKPPRLDGTERETVLGLLRYQRESLVRKLEGIDDDDARRSPVASGTSLLWLARHMARAEVTWVLRRWAGRDVPLGDDAVGPDDRLSDAVAAYRAAWADVDAALGDAPLDQLCRAPDAEPNVNLRWVLMHLLEETARHAGHADILRELIDGSVGR